VEQHVKVSSCRESVRTPFAFLAALLACATAAHAYTVNIAPRNPRTIYLQVGVGTFTGGTYNSGGSPAVNTTVNRVSVIVPAAQVGTGTAQTMTTDSTASRSLLDNFAFCNLPNQLYVGGFYRSTGAGAGSAAATLRAAVPPGLVNAGGQSIPFSQISWTSAGNGDTGAQPFPAGAFVSGGTQTIGTINRNQWAESCHTFSFANTAIVAAGTYTGRVTYTLSAP
jgi:hypothetical protein